MNISDKTVNGIVIAVVGTLCVIIFAMVVALLKAMFTDTVDSKEIFAIIGPAFSTVIGSFVGLIGGLAIGKQQIDQK